MKRLLTNKEDFSYWFNSYNREKWCINSYEETEPLNYPCVVVYNESENFNSYRENLDYEFVYLNDFKE